MTSNTNGLFAHYDGPRTVVAFVFGGTFVASGILGIALWALSGANFAIWATAAAAAGTVLASLLWSQGWQGPASRAHTTALTIAGALLYLGSGTLGGAATVVFFAAVLTAAGLRQLSGAAFAFAGFIAVLLLAATAAAEVQDVLGLSAQMRSDRREILLTVLDLVSFLALGLYVVVLDKSLRKAWAESEERNQELLANSAALHSDIARLRAEKPVLDMAQRRHLRLATLAVEMSDRSTSPDPMAKVTTLLREEVPQLGAPRRFLRLLDQQDIEPMVADLSDADQAFVRAIAVLVLGKTPSPESVA